MKHQKFAVTIFLFVTILMFSRCSAVEGIFKAGVWTGIIIILVIIGLIVFIIARARK